jgi:hypothetical protein
LPRPDKSKLAGHKAHDAMQLLKIREVNEETPGGEETTEDFEKLISKYENILSSDENKSKNTPPQSISSKSGLSHYNNKKEDSWDSMLQPKGKTIPKNESLKS